MNERFSTKPNEHALAQPKPVRSTQALFSFDLQLRAVIKGVQCVQHYMTQVRFIDRVELCETTFSTKSIEHTHEMRYKKTHRERDGEKTHTNNFRCF